ncbi:MAG: TlpA family protein disulfide reductase [Bacteroidales bacterium]|nr:TlpA family protein disulfide reductase [Bacteroidales bacterium]
MKKVILIILLFISGIIYGQDVTIEGENISYKGDELIFYTYSDYITKIPKEIGRCIVDTSGHFLCNISINKTEYCFIYLGVYKGMIFLEPGNNYKINLPPKTEKTFEEKVNPFFEECELYLGIKNSNNNELNILIRTFDEFYEGYIQDRFLNIYRNASNSNVDTIIDYIDSVFVSDNLDFLNYKKYKCASLKNLAYQRNIKYVVKEYFLNQAVLYNNIAYMHLFNRLFDNYFSFYSRTKEGERVFSDIVYAKSPKYISETLNNNIALSNDTLKELIILKGLHDAFYDYDFPFSPLLQTLDSVLTLTTIPEHKLIAENIKQKVTKLRTGYPSPVFELFDKDSTLWKSGQFKGKYVYLNFCTDWSYTCKKDLETLKKLQQEHNNVLQVVTISADEDFNKLLDYFNEKKYNWKLLHFGNYPEILKEYKIKAYPIYYLIDPYGKLVMSPAPSPNENFELYFFKILRSRK